jgi:N-acetyl sugar amidotransferase
MYNNKNLKFYYDDPFRTVNESLKKKFQKDYIICSNCLFDTSIYRISFDSKGVCSFCNGYKNKKIIKNIDFQKSIQLIKKNTKSKYDCLVGLSGGVDSSYVAIKCKELNLKTLLVHFDNGWNTEVASKNIEIIQKYTGFDLITHVVDWEEFRNLQLSFLKSGLTNFEAPSDHGIFASMYNYALKEKINYIITGVNSATEFMETDNNEERLKFWHGYLYHDLHHLKSINKIFSKNNDLKTFPMISIFKRKYLEIIGKIKTFNILDYINYNKDIAIEELKKIGWKEYQNKHYESVITRFHQSFILPVKFGLDKRMWHLSSLIWSKQIKRSKSIEIIKENICNEKILVQDYYFFLKKFNFNQNEFKLLLSNENKFYSDYPNRYWLIKSLINLRKKFS